MGEVITFISGKGGQGKTALAANIAVGLCSEGKNVLAIDLCYGNRALDLALGLENMILYHLSDVLDGRCDLSTAAVRPRNIERLSLLAAPLTKDISALNADRLKAAIAEWKNIFDYIIIDCPSGMGHGLNVALFCSDRIVTVLTPDTLGVRSADKLISNINVFFKDRIDLIINMIHPAYLKAGVQMNPDEIGDILPQPVIGVIPFSSEIHISICKGENVYFAKNKMLPLYSGMVKKLMNPSAVLPDWKKYVKSKLS